MFVALLCLGMAPGRLAAGDEPAGPPLVLTLQRGAESNRWSLAWPTRAGERYTLQKSADLIGWINVVTITAQGGTETRTDTGIPNQTRTFWRVAHLSGGNEPVTVSEVVAGYQLGGGESQALLQVITGGSQFVSQVLFYDRGILLGDAAPGLGNTWTFGVVWNGQDPQASQISARVITEEGVVLDTPGQSFLLADPAQFVPLGEGGVPVPGRFVGIDAAGLLQPFLFFPEGAGDGALKTGAHFEFAGGAKLVAEGGSVEIEFNGARFFRGHGDPSPLAATPGLRRLAPDDCRPASIASALGLPSGAALSLLWGRVPVRWTGGELSRPGWAALQVLPPLDALPLPSVLECVTVGFDPVLETPALIFCLHGSWAPAGSGAQFVIPRSDPLTIHLGLTGELAARGTVEATLAGGASVRGSVSWRDPNFEVRFQGRNIVIPAFTSLRRALPMDAADCLPAASTTAELDAAARCLTSFRDTYRALALGGLAESPLESGGAVAPLPVSMDTVGAALQAWSARVASWTADRAGQALDAEMLRDLGQAVVNAARTGEAAYDLPTVLKLLRDVVILRRHQESALGSTPDAGQVRGQLRDAEERLLAAADRITAAGATLEPSPEFNEIVRLLALAGAEAAGAAGAGGGIAPAGGGTTTRLRQVMQSVQAKLGVNFLARRAIAAGDFNGTDNPALVGKDSGVLLGFLDEVAVCLELLRAAGLATSVEDTPAGYPLQEALLQVRPNFAQAHNAAAAAAIAGRDYGRLRAAVADRARFFELNARLGLPLPSDHNGFLPTTRALLDTYADVLEGLPNRTRAQYCGADFAAVDAIVSSTTDGGRNSESLDRALALVTGCSDLLTASAGADRRCDDLVQALLGTGVTIAPRDPAAEASSFPDLSGRYESAEDAGETYATVQLSQGGRYVQGRMQLQRVRPDRSNARYLIRELEGWFLRQTSEPGTMELAFRSVDPASGQATFFRGTARREADGATVLTLNGQAFAQIARRPVFAEAVINAFEKTQRDAVRSANETPMHHRILSRVAERARALRLIIERYYSDSAMDEQELTEAGNLNDALEGIRNMVSAGQRPMARLTIRQVLSSSTFSVLKSKVAGSPLIGGRIDRSYWELALGMALERPGLLTEAPEMLGFAPAELVSVDQYRYNITIQQKSFPLKAIFGASELDVTIKKFRPDGSQEATYHYDGFITTAGISAGFGVTISDTSRDVLSPFNYGPADFEGELRFTQIAAGFAFAEIGVSGGFGALELLGSGRFPGIVLNLSEISNQFGLAAQIGWDVGAGLLVTEGANPDPEKSLLFDDVVRFEARAEGRFDQAVFFEVDSDVISSCGLQFLREFVAEYRLLFEADKSFVEIRGLTDRTGSAAYNLDLSQRRANAVRDALLAFVGPDLRITTANTSAIGLGEAPAAAAGVPDAPNPAADNAQWRRVDVVVGGSVLATIPTPPGRNP